jgi:chromosome segregation ATPase
LKVSVGQLKKDQINISQDNSDSRELLQTVASRLEAEENKLRTAQTDLMRAQSDRGSVQGLLADQKAKEAELSLKITEWQAQEATLTASISLLKSNQFELRGAENSIKVNLATAEKELEEVAVDLVINRKNLSQLKGSLSSTDLELKKADIELRDKAEAVAASRIADAKLDGIRIDVAVLEERESNLLESIQKNNNELASLKNELKLLKEQQVEIHGDQNEIARLKAIQKDLAREVDHLTKRLADLIKGIGEFEKEGE